MRLSSAVLASFVVLAWGAACQAGTIIAGAAADDGDGAITCVGTWNTNAQTMTMVGNQYWGPGHVGKEDLSDNRAYLQAETEEDPIVTLRTIIDNDTAFDWTGYLVSIAMNKPFTLLSPAVNVPNTSEAGWSVQGLGSYPLTATAVGSQWVADVTFVGGTAIAAGTGVLDFSYQLQFVGSVRYCQEMTPIPEPSSIVLALVGMVGMLVVRRKFAS